MNITDFKISCATIPGTGIEVTDISPWGSGERDVVAFAVFYDSGTMDVILDNPFFDKWVIEMLVNSNVNVKVFGIPRWSSLVQYKTGDIVLASDDTLIDGIPAIGDNVSFFMADQASLNKVPATEDTYWTKIDSVAAATLRTYFEALVNDGNYTYYEAECNEIVDTNVVSFEKTECYKYDFDLSGTDAVAYRLRTLDQFINNHTPIVSWGNVDGDSLSIDLSSHARSDGTLYKEGVYVVDIMKGTEDVTLLIDRLVIVEICAVVKCFKKIVMDTICKTCGCDSNPCTDEEIALDRKRRDFINLFLSSFLLSMAYINEEYVKSIHAETLSIVTNADLASTDMLISRLIEITESCNMCNDD